MTTKTRKSAKRKAAPDVHHVIRVMTERYGPFEEEPRLDAAHEITFTILSQHTSDTNSSRAYHLLMDKFGTLEAVAAGDVSEIEKAIAPGGLARIKAPRIKRVLSMILELNGSMDLSFLRELPLSEAKAWLRQLPGIGPKSAGIILSFALGMPAMAIDTHIYRVSKRLALIGPKVTVDKAHDILEEAVEPDQVYPFHLAIITHGRQVCKAQRPLCGECVVGEECPSREEMMAPAKASAKKASGATAKGRTKKAARLPHSVAITE